MVCMRCGRTIHRLDAPRAIFVAEQDEIFGLSQSSVEYADGRTGWLHASCFYVPKYRELPPPTPPREFGSDIDTLRLERPNAAD